MSGSSLIETIEDFLAHASPQVRSNACVALGALEGGDADEAARHLIERALYDTDETVRAVALAALSALPLPQRQVAANHMCSTRKAGRGEAGMQLALRALGPDALKGTPVESRLTNPTVWRLALLEGMPLQARDWLRTDIGALIAVALLAFLIVIGLTAWAEGRAGLTVESEARLGLQLGAALLATALLWLQTRRQGALMRHQRLTLGVVVESLWSVAVAVLAAGVAMAVGGTDGMPAVPGNAKQYPQGLALLLAAAMALGLRWGTWAGLLPATRGWERQSRALVGMLGALGGLAAMAWAVLHALDADAPSRSLAQAWLPMFGAAMAAMAVVMAWRETHDSEAVMKAERLRPVSQLAGLTGLGLMALAMMSAESRVQGAMSRTAPLRITPKLINGHWISPPVRVQHLPFRVTVNLPEQDRKQDNTMRNLMLKLRASPFVDKAAGVDESKSYDKLDPILVVFGDSGDLAGSFDDPERGCVNFGKLGSTMVLRKQAGDEGDSLGRLPLGLLRDVGDDAGMNEGRPAVTNWKSLVHTLMQRGTYDYGRQLASIELELGDADAMADDAACRSSVTGDRRFEATAEIQTPLGVIRRGARVLIRKPAVTDDDLYWNPSMDRLDGKELVVDSVDRGRGYFRARGESWTWSKDWVLRIEPPAAGSAPSSAASR